MAKAIGVEALASAVDDILEEYGDEIRKHVDEATEKVAKKAVKSLRQESSARFGGTGRYAKGWKATTERDAAAGTKVTLHNAKLPGLPHLLEHGHAKRGGGRTQGVAHIAPIEQETIRLYEEMLRREL